MQFYAVTFRQDRQNVFFPSRSGSLKVILKYLHLSLAGLSTNGDLDIVIEKQAGVLHAGVWP